jgi:predicted ATPase
MPWGDRAAFAELMLRRDMGSHEEATACTGPVVLDRGVPDVLRYLTLCGLPVSAPLRKAAELYRYKRRVVHRPAVAIDLRAGCGAEAGSRGAEATYTLMSEG